MDLRDDRNWVAGFVSRRSSGGARQPTSREVETLPGFSRWTEFGVRVWALAGILLKPYSRRMSPLRARVEKGRLVLDEPTTLPDGTMIDLVADDEGDDLTDAERRALHDMLSSSWLSAEAGRLRPASAILDELRRRR